MKSKIIVFIILFYISFFSFVQSSIYILQEEELIFKFETFSGKICSISINKNAEYIIYRFGTLNKIELQYPSDLENSWDLFKYEYYSRGGGDENEGLSTGYLYFLNNGYKYTIYDEWYSLNNEHNVGILIITPDGKEIEIKGKPETIEGGLYKLDNEDYPIKNQYY